MIFVWVIKKGVIIKIFNITVFNNSKYDIEKEFVIVDSSKNNENFTCASALEEFIKMMNIFITYLVKRVNILK